MLSTRALAALAVLASGCAVSGHPYVPGVAPTHVGGVWLCPQTAPVAAFGHVDYPPYHPAPPPKTRRPARCYDTLATARAQGGTVAPAPPGGMLVSGVYLVPPDASLARICRSSARRADVQVPCPTLIPGAGYSAFCIPNGCASRGAFVLEGSFSGPPSYAGVGPGTGHLWVIAFNADSGVWPASTLIGGRTVGHVTVRGRPGRYLEFPEGSELNSGHVVLVWRAGGVTYAVSLHGHTPLNERLDLLIARHLHMVAP